MNQLCCIDLTVQHEQKLLRVARGAAVRRLSGNAEASECRGTIEGKYGGVFVTFWHGTILRGCVGTFQPTEDIGSQVADVTLSSLVDPRFVNQPITLLELAELCIELSVISGMERVRDVSEIIVGVHGIVVRQGGATGCFLPKVAEEHGWSAETFLSNCCSMKAGLAADAWRESRTEIYRFTARVFREEPREPIVKNSCA